MDRLHIEIYDVWLLFAGLAAFGAAFLPRLVARQAISFPLIYIGLGIILFSLPLPINAPDPVEHAVIAERVTELVVIIALMTTGLRIDRRFGWRSWGTTWRLLAITMPLTIAAAALLGWWVLGLAPVSAVLLGAVLAPTDPVMASDVQTPPPSRRPIRAGEDSELRFGLTSEAGLNDGLGFPFTNLAIAMAVLGAAPAAWVGGWLLVDVAYKIGVGIGAGLVLGWVIAWTLFRRWGRDRQTAVMEGSVAIAITLVVYGATELLNGYGFLAVFVAASVVRQYERTHEYHGVLHDFAEDVEHLLMAGLLLLLGGAVAGGLLSALTWQGAAVAVLVVFAVRPVTGVLGLLGQRTDWWERLAIAFFGIRGMGSLYYLAYALNHGGVPNADVVWATVGATVLLSAVVHGVTATPAVTWLERRERSAGPKRKAA